jgi:branched-subunit amino acid aminotransferase/4-amino-4-deoxychorismate lyase
MTNDAQTNDALEPLALTNYGHFTSMQVHNGRVRGLTLHLDRLVRDCAALFGAPLDPEFVRSRIRTAARRQPARPPATAEPVTVRVTVCDPAFSVPNPAASATPHIVVTTRAAPPPRQAPLRVRSVHYTRDVPEVKHTGLFGPLFERRRAQIDGYDDAVFVADDGRLSEGVTWNIGFVAGESLVWPKAEMLPGVTMALLSAAHRGPVRIEPVGLDNLSDMTAAFATNAIGGVRAISAIDSVAWPAEHPMLEQLQTEYAAIEPELL